MEDINNVLPVNVDALGAVANLEDHLVALDLEKKEEDRMQLSALLL